MLSVFPGILYLAPFAATILRIGAGLSFIYIGYMLIVRREEIHQAKLPIVGHAAQWMLIAAGAITLIDGFALLVGLWTQIAAILGMLIALKHVLLSRKFDAVEMIPRSTSLLLFLMCLCLLLTGAGPFGFDLPL